MISNSILKSRNAAHLAFLSAAAFLFFIQQAHNVTYFPHDAKGYWHLSDPEVFFDYPTEIRGYVYPLLLLPAHFITNLFVGFEPYPYRIYSSIIYGYGLTVVLPSFYQQAFGGEVTFGRRLIPPALVATLFPGIVIYPLSDLPAFLLSIGAICCLMKAKHASSITKAVALAIFSGILAAGAYNTRTIYLFPLLCVLVTVPVYFFSARPPIQRVLGLAAFVVGLVIVSIPQSIINYKTHGSRSPAVISQKTQKSLFALQLMWGITIQRYESVFDPLAAAPSRYFMDRAGEQLFAREKVEKAAVSVANYASLLVRHPTEFLGIYGRHLVNGLDLRDGEVYVHSTTHSSNKIAFFNFFIISLALLAVFLRYAHRKTRIQDVSPEHFAGRTPADSLWPAWLFIVVLPVCAILPGAIETRFFVPLHLLLYSTIAFNLSHTGLASYLRQNWPPIICGFVVLATLFFSISTNTMSSMQYFIHPAYRFGL